MLLNTIGLLTHCSRICNGNSVDAITIKIRDVIILLVACLMKEATENYK